MPDWSKIKKNAQIGCFNCRSKRSYGNPFWKCFECKKRFCADCIWGGQIKKGMRENEEVRDICDDCKKEKDYNNL